MCERQQGGLVVNGSFIGALRRQYPEEVSAIIHHVMHDHPEGQAFMKSGQEDEDGIADEESTRIYSTVLFPHYAALKRGELEFEILDRYPYLGIVQPVSPASESPKV